MKLSAFRSLAYAATETFQLTSQNQLLREQFLLISVCSSTSYRHSTLVRIAVCVGILMTNQFVSDVLCNNVQFKLLNACVCFSVWTIFFSVCSFARSFVEIVKL